jgi:hypothetical protein
MRLPRFRFTVGRMMVLVAVAAVAILVGDSLRRLSGEYADKAERYRYGAFLAVQGYPGGSPDQLRQSDLLRGFARKYDRAARFPWLPVRPDPREPGPPEYPRSSPD